VNGRLIQQVFRGSLTAGAHTAVIDGEGLSSGIYFAAVKAGEKSSKVKVTLVK